MSNAVNHPSHYNSGKIEVIEAIEDWKLGFHLGNAVKYTARAGKKDPAKTVEDLEKAVWYLKREIERIKAEKEGREVVRPNDMNPRASEAPRKFEDWEIREKLKTNGAERSEHQVMNLPNHGSIPSKDAREADEDESESKFKKKSKYGGPASRSVSEW